MRTANPLNRNERRAAARASRDLNDGRPLLTIDEAAAYLNVSRRSVYRYINAGLLRSSKVGDSGPRRLRPSDCDDFYDKHMAS